MALRAAVGDAAEVVADSGTRYPPAVEAAAYFCCLEAVQNAAKHAGAARVRVELGGDADELRLSRRGRRCRLRPRGRRARHRSGQHARPRRRRRGHAGSSTPPPGAAPGVRAVLPARAAAGPGGWLTCSPGWPGRSSSVAAVLVAVDVVVVGPGGVADLGGRDRGARLPVRARRRPRLRADGRADRLPLRAAPDRLAAQCGGHPHRGLAAHRGVRLLGPGERRARAPRRWPASRPGWPSCSAARSSSR